MRDFEGPMSRWASLPLYAIHFVSTKVRVEAKGFQQRRGGDISNATVAKFKAKQPKKKYPQEGFKVCDLRDKHHAKDQWRKLWGGGGLGGNCPPNST